MKSHLFFIIFIVSSFLLTIQLITLQFIVKKTKHDPNYQWELLKKVELAANAQKIPLVMVDSNILHRMEELSSCKLLKRNVINQRSTASILEISSPFYNQVNILKKSELKHSFTEISKNVPASCVILCDVHKEQKVVNLATLHEFVSTFQLLKFTEELKRHGLICIEIGSEEFGLASYDLNVKGLSHLVIFDDRLPKNEAFIVHLILLNEIFHSHWYSNPFSLTENDKRVIHRKGARKMHFQFQEFSHIYSMTSLLQKNVEGLALYFPEESLEFYQPADKVRFIRCNQTRARKFFQKNIGNIPNESQDILFKENAYYLLAKTKKILDNLGIPFWLSSGTCLGYFRQCDFITYSGDLDIGIFIKDYREEIVDAFLMHNLPLIHLFGKPEDSFEMSFRDENLKLDIFFFYEEIDHYWNGGTQAKSGRKFKYKFPKFDLCWTDFMNMLVRVPCDTLTYIRANYGDNWEEPVKQWDWKSSPSNVEENGQWNPEEWHKVIQLYNYPDMS